MATPTVLPDPWIPWNFHQEAKTPTDVVVTSGAIVTANNHAHYWPVVFPCDATVYALRMAATNGTGNYDIGFYDAALNQLASSGSTAMSAAGIKTLTLPELRVKGGVLYYAAFAFSSTSGTVIRAAYTIAAMTRAVGHGIQASALPLPNPGVPTSAAAYLVAPVFAFGVR